MIRLIEASKVRSRLSLPDDDGINEAIASAIDATLPSLRAVLQTEFDAGTSTDLFFIDPEVHRPLGGFYTLKARNGFINKESVLVGYAITVDGLQSIAPTITPPIIISDKGFVRVEEQYVNSYVKLSYSYGFEETDEIPSWLQEVAISYVAKVLSSQQVSDQKPALTNLYKFIDLHGGGILDAHLRVMTEAIRALN